MEEILNQFDHEKFPYFFNYLEEVKSKDILESKLVIHKYENREFMVRITPYYKHI